MIKKTVVFYKKNITVIKRFSNQVTYFFQTNKNTLQLINTFFKNMKI